MTDVQKLAEVLDVLVCQELGKTQEGSALRLVYSKCRETLDQLKYKEESNG